MSLRKENELCSSDNELPVLHRLAITYLMLPVMIWLLGWFQWWLSIPATVLLALGLWKALAGSWRSSVRPAMLVLLLVVTLARVLLSVTGGLFDFNTGEWLGIPATALLVFALWKAMSGSSSRSSIRPATLALLLVAAGWVMLAPAGGLLDTHNADWLKHRLTLLDLGRYSWPTYLPVHLHYLFPDSELSILLLRYYLGYFMVPGLAGHWFGLAALNWALPLWTWLGVVLILLLFTRSYRGWKVILAVVVLVFFSGMDIVRTVLFEGWDWIELSVDLSGWPWLDLGRYHLEWNHWGVRIQYSSNMTGLMWVPHHFISAALYTLLLVQLRRQPRFLAVSGVVLAASLFWSPFVALGLLPLVVVLLLENGLRPFLRWQNLCLAPPLAALLALYLTSGSVDFLRGWLWHRYEWGLLAKVLPVFLLTEFLVLAFLLWLLQPQLRREPFFLAALVTLLILPGYYYGEWNDLCMRASLPALFLLCCYSTSAIARDHIDIIRKGRYYRRLALAGLVLVLGVGSITASFEIARAGNTSGVIRYEGLNTSLSDLPQRLQRENTTLVVPTLLRVLLRNNADIHRTYEKGELIIRSNYDVYLREDWLIYTKSACSQGDTDATFFLHLIPADEKDLPDDRRQHGFDSLEFHFGKHGARSGEECVATRELPAYDISQIRTGQFMPEEGRVWEGSFSFDE